MSEITKGGWTVRSQQSYLRCMTYDKYEDGSLAHLVSTAFFDGHLEIPRLEKNDTVKLPRELVPFSYRKRPHKKEDFVCFYEYDYKFEDVLKNPERYLDDLATFSGVITPDCSLYWDTPLVKQASNVYDRNAIGYYLQKKGLYVVPNVRWGDERTYTAHPLREPIAFLGIPKKSVVAIGTYGCIKSKEAKRHFKAGLSAMLDYLEPTHVLVYGSMPESIFGEFKDRAVFVAFRDWTRRQHEDGKAQIEGK